MGSNEEFVGWEVFDGYTISEAPGSGLETAGRGVVLIGGGTTVVIGAGVADVVGGTNPPVTGGKA